MRSIAEIMRSNRRYDILGGRTLAENAERWAGARTAAPGYVRRDARGPLLEHLFQCGTPSRIAELAAKVAAGELPQRHATLATREWLQADESILLLHGDSGGGKSVGAASVFEAAWETVRWEGGEETRWTPHGCWFLEVSMLARQSYFDAEGKALVQQLKRVTLLVLDDLGQELMSAPYLSTLDEVLCDRFTDRRKRTVLTTNVSAKRPGADKPSPFEERYGARVARRIRESGRVVHVEKPAEIHNETRRSP